MIGLENPIHWLFILVVALIVFGPKRLPQVGRALGGGIREFRDSVRGLAGHEEDEAASPKSAEPPEAPREPPSRR